MWRHLTGHKHHQQKSGALHDSTIHPMVVHIQCCLICSTLPDFTRFPEISHIIHSICIIHIIYIIHSIWRFNIPSAISCRTISVRLNFIYILTYTSSTTLILLAIYLSINLSIYLPIYLSHDSAARYCSVSPPFFSPSFPPPSLRFPLLFFSPFSFLPPISHFLQTSCIRGTCLCPPTISSACVLIYSILFIATLLTSATLKLKCTTLYCTTLHYTTIHHNTPRYPTHTTLHCTALTSRHSLSHRGGLHGSEMWYNNELPQADPSFLTLKRCVWSKSKQNCTFKDFLEAHFANIEW